MGRGTVWSISGVLILFMGYWPGGSAQQDVPKGCASPSGGQIQKSSPSAYIWMDYIHRDRPLQYWIRIKASGDAWWVEYGDRRPAERGGVAYPRIFESKCGHLSPAEVKNLFDLIKRGGFFQMKDAYGGEGMVSEDDILELCASIGGTVKTVYARPPSFIPKQLSEIVQAIKGVVGDLQEDKRFGAFFRGEKLDEARASSLASKFKFIPLSEEQFKDHPYLREAIESLGQFVYAGSGKDIYLNSPIKGHNFLLVATPEGKFQLDIYLREKP